MNAYKIIQLDNEGQFIIVPNSQWSRKCWILFDNRHDAERRLAELNDAAERRLRFPVKQDA